MINFFFFKFKTKNKRMNGKVCGPRVQLAFTINAICHFEYFLLCNLNNNASYLNFVGKYNFNLI